MFPERALEGHPVSHLPLLLVSFLLFTASLGCASPIVPAVGSTGDGRLPAVATADRRVFPTIEAAVDDALASAGRERGPARRERFLFGTIRSVPGGYVWTAPVRSRATVGALRPQGIRLPLGVDDVAIYGLHPRSGRSEVDRLNERVSRQEKRAVDEQDGAPRPLYVLTPSRRIVRYPEVTEGFLEALEVVRRDGAGAP